MNQFSRYLINTVITSLPLIAAMLLAWWGLAFQSMTHRSHELIVIMVYTTDQMEQEFRQLGYQWPPKSGPTIPRVTVKSLPRDLDSIDDNERRKSLFIRALLPSILAENQHLRMLRSRVETILKNGLSATEMSVRQWLYNIMQLYRIDGDITQPAVQQQLLRRLDEFPPALVLAQAANESGWGTSRFALEGNNLFGIWTFKRDKGIIPAARAEDMEHTVRSFPDIRASVKAYLYTLNVGRSYINLRTLRENMRQNHQALDAITLANGLLNYSQRGSDYIDDIRTIIERNRLYLLDSVDLHPIDVELVLNSPVHSESTGG